MNQITKMLSQVKKFTDRDRLKRVNPFSELNPGVNQIGIQVHAELE